MPEDWSLDVRKYAPAADDAAIAGIVRHCGIALRKRDSSLVSMADATETARVRDGFLKKKLGLTLPDADLDAAIAQVGHTMQGDRTKNRVTVYYLLAQHFDRLDLFRKRPATTRAKQAAAEAPPPPHEHTLADTLAEAGHVAGAVVGAAAGAIAGTGLGAGAVAGAETAERVTEEVAPTHAERAPEAAQPQALIDQPAAEVEPRPGSSRAVLWLLLALVVLAVLGLTFGR